MDKSATGKLGEDLACEYLVDKGYKILKRNYRRPWGELDIVARAKNNVLVFVEVKALSENPAGGLSPEDHLTVSKLRKLQRTCMALVGEKPEWVIGDRGWQIDLIAINIPVGADNPNLKNCEIRHYENI
ncbi:MAG: YraN family protein [Candidatus Liptonbacteria bacterium]|nr:YraN family protein [Candidatus Liptonbacteria bacterium]